MVMKKNSKKKAKKLPVKKTVKKIDRYVKVKTVKKNITGKTSKRKSKMKRVTSGIKNLDRIVEGGFEKNSTNLVVGGSGNGKSIFALQFLIEGVKKGEKVLYIAFEEKKSEFYANMLELGWDLDKLEKSGKFFFLSYTPEKVKTMLEEGGGDIETIVLTENIERIVMDSITTFVALFDRDVEMRQKALGLFSLLRSWTCTTILIYERDPLIDKKQSSRVLEFEADSLILLYFTRIKRKRERFLEVYKMRGTNHSTDVFSYKINTNKGITVSPRPYSGNLDDFKTI
jgi:circadian clock protein KaiC